MNITTLYFLAGTACLVMYLPIDGSAGESDRIQPAQTLEPFWRGIARELLPASSDGEWSDSARQQVFDYCKRFANKSGPKKLLPAMIADLVESSSEPHAFIYTWVVLGWRRKEVMPILRRYCSKPNPVTQRVAADFIAEIEEQTHR